MLQKYDLMASQYSWRCGTRRELFLRYISAPLSNTKICCAADKKNTRCSPSPHGDVVKLTTTFPIQRLRPLSYSKAHVILIAFAIDTPDSLENVTVKVRPLGTLPPFNFAIQDVHRTRPGHCLCLLVILIRLTLLVD